MFTQIKSQSQLSKAVKATPALCPHVAWIPHLCGHKNPLQLVSKCFFTSINVNLAGSKDEMKQVKQAIPVSNQHWCFVYSKASLCFMSETHPFPLYPVWMIHWNAHLVCNWLHSQPAESFLFCPCDVGRPSNGFDLIETRRVLPA